MCAVCLKACRLTNAKETQVYPFEVLFTSPRENGEHYLVEDETDVEDPGKYDEAQHTCQHRSYTI